MPTAELNRRGSWRGKTAARKREPKPATMVRRPSYLSPIARGEWNRVAPELMRLGLLTLLDVSALAAYCEAFAEWRKATQWIQKNGMTMDALTSDGRVKWSQPVPHVGIAHKALEKMQRFGSRFGLTPSDRVGLCTTEAKEDDGAAELAAVLGLPKLKVTG